MDFEKPMATSLWPWLSKIFPAPPRFCQSEVANSRSTPRKKNRRAHRDSVHDPSMKPTFPRLFAVSKIDHQLLLICEPLNQTPVSDENCVTLSFCGFFLVSEKVLGADSPFFSTMVPPGFVWIQRFGSREASPRNPGAAESRRVFLRPPGTLPARPRPNPPTWRLARPLAPKESGPWGLGVSPPEKIIA